MLRETREEELDRAVDELLRRLYRGEDVDWAGCFEEYPQCAEELNELAPIMEGLVQYLHEKWD